VSELLVMMEGRVVARIERVRGRMTLTYNEAWRAYPGTYPLSLSMPLAAARHPHAPLDSFLWGLLPDNEATLAQWAARFRVSARSCFALLGEVGEDCAGAVQFVAPAALDRVLSAGPGEVVPIPESEIAERLRLVRENAGRTRLDRDTGQFSLAGAQPKIALWSDGKSWGVPAGRMPTTHILKPQMPGWDGLPENEHFCLSLAQAVGLPAVQSSVRRFEDVPAIVVRRYDRVETQGLVVAAALRAAAAAAKAAELSAAGDATGAAAAAAEAAAFAADAEVMRGFSASAPVYRVHQEDFCQALGVHPSQKYQADGGPGPKAVGDFLRAVVSPGAGRGAKGGSPNSAVTAAEEDVLTFAAALMFNWLIGGTDAHAKNYSLLLGASGLVRLAPLYDIASALAHPHLDPRRAKLAMKIGGEYRLEAIGRDDWVATAAAMRVGADVFFARFADLVDAVEQAVPERLAAARRDGLDHPVLDRLADAILGRADRARRALF